MNTYRELPQGTVRINTPRIAAELVFMPLLKQFTRKFPDIRLELATNDGFVDIIRSTHPGRCALVGQGLLVRVLEDWSVTFPGFFLYYPGHRQLPAALRAVISSFRLPLSNH
ncbi:LysR substrate-binding domain-containing protein [Rahnella sp. PCH160]|uniref:LysR substrate-binding domain-containing protein n=1 Tax=Rahnella sp. PCH160 TaxID=3447928 RepID=UPI0039FD4DC5